MRGWPSPAASPSLQNPDSDYLNGSLVSPGYLSPLLCLTGGPGGPALLQRNGSQGVPSSSPREERPRGSDVSLTRSPLFLGSAWRGQQTQEGTKAPWDELSGQRTVGRGPRRTAPQARLSPLQLPPPPRRAEGSPVPCAALTVNHAAPRRRRRTSSPVTAGTCCERPGQGQGLLCDLETPHLHPWSRACGHRQAS